MDCSNRNENDTDGKRNLKPHGGRISHIWMMLVCCAAPLVLILVIFLLGASLPGLRTALISVLPFVCPIMMIGMLPMMFMHGRHDEGHERIENDSPDGINTSDHKRLNQR